MKVGYQLENRLSTTFREISKRVGPIERSGQIGSDALRKSTRRGSLARETREAVAMRTRAVVARSLGGPEVLEAAEIDLVWPGRPGNVLVRLAAASLNPADVWFRILGPYVKGPGPLVLGHDGAGFVEAVGPGVTRVKPGDRVAFCHGGIGADPGTYATHAVVPAELLALIPEGVPFETAAALPLVAITAVEAVVERAAVQPGETLLVQGGAGGTGHMAVQIGRLAGARVAATVSTEAKAALAENLGAERTIDYRSEDFVAATRAWTEGKGLDTAFDNQGGETLLRTFKAMAPYGRIATLIGTPGDNAETTAYNLNLTLHNVMMLTPMWLGLNDRLLSQRQIVDRALADVAAGRLRVHVSDTFPLTDVAAAHRRLEAGGATGKIVLRIP
jgi:NADPH2:quinone reductase